MGQKCPECAAPEGRHRVVSRAEIRRETRSGSPVAFLLIVVNVVVFFAGQFDPSLGRRLLIEFAHHPLLVDAGDWYRVATAMFLHGGLMHILFNSYALWLFGPALERRFGSVSFASLYLAAGLAGGALYQVVGREQFAVGASGAIFGLFGALLAATYRQRHTPAGRPLFSQLVVLLGINLALPFIVPNIAWEAHIGGLAAGMAIATTWDRIPITGAGAVPRRVAVSAAVMVVAAVAVLLA